MKVNIGGGIGLCSEIENSPVQIALQRLGVQVVKLNAASLSDENLSRYSAIVVDQFALEKFLALFKRSESIERWVNDGGRLIILPQYGFDRTMAQLRSQKGLFAGDEIKFSYLPVVGCREKVIIDSTAKIFKVPSEISEGSFSSKFFPISYGGITGIKAQETGLRPRRGDRRQENLLQSGDHVLLLEERVGQGTIFYCAINLYPRLLSIDETSYKLLANLISR